jgi:hypothetical protein
MIYVLIGKIDKAEAKKQWAYSDWQKLKIKFMNNNCLIPAPDVLKTILIHTKQSQMISRCMWLQQPASPA